MASLKQVLDGLTGHRTMLMTGFCLIVFTLLIVYLAIAGKAEMLQLLLSNLVLYGTFVLMLAGSAQFDKVANGVNAKLSK